LGSSAEAAVFLTDLPGLTSSKAVIKLISENTVDPSACTAAWAVTTTLSHPHLMPILHTGRCRLDNAPLLYTVSEYADEVLSEILPERPLTPIEAGQLLYPILDVLAYLHAHGCVHGRLKPSNLLVVGSDLKLSSDRLQLLGESDPAPREQANRKLSIYDPPEITTQPLSAATDVWSLGVTLVEALTQHPPLWERSADSDPVVPHSIPKPFAEIAAGCLRTDPALRCTLRDINERLSPSPPLPHPEIEPEQAKPAGLRLPVLIGLFLLSAVLAALYWHFHRLPPQPLHAETPEAQPVAAAAPPQAQAPPPVPAAPAPAQSDSPSPEPAAATASTPPAPPPVPAPQPSNSAATRGAVDQQVLPDVLPKARDTIQGKVSVKVRVNVDPDGNVSGADFDTPATSKYFSNLALQAARRWKFQAPQVDGHGVASTWTLHFLFRQSETTVTPVQTSP
jgi:TonB family protein